MTVLFGHGPEDGTEWALNRLPSFDRCRRQGADGVECDVRRTADDQLVVIHDAMAGDGRTVEGTPRSELPAFVPDLDHVLDTCRGLIVNLELKNFPRDPGFDPTQRVTHLVLDRLAARGHDDRVLISCFDVAAIDLVRAEAPSIPTAMLYLSRRPAADLLDRVVDHGHRFVHPYDTMVDGTFMELAGERALRVNVWTGLVDDRRLETLVDLGVDGLITSEVAAARRAIDRPRPH